MATGRTTLNGYGWKHQQARARVKRLVDAGRAYCARCGGYIVPGEPFDLDHTLDRTSYLGPSHRSCNRAEPNKRRQAKLATAEVRPRLRWSRVVATLYPVVWILARPCRPSEAVRRGRRRDELERAEFEIAIEKVERARSAASGCPLRTQGGDPLPRPFASPSAHSVDALVERAPALLARGPDASPPCPPRDDRTLRARERPGPDRA
jgi:hypothetical protein